MHHAIVRVLEPLFERRFIPDSYACRKRKGTHAAVALANRYRGDRRLRALDHADGLLDDTRFLVRFATDLGYLSARQYEFASKQLAELGRLLGGWRKVTKKR